MTDTPLELSQSVWLLALGSAADAVTPVSSAEDLVLVRAAQGDPSVLRHALAIGEREPGPSAACGRAAGRLRRAIRLCAAPPAA